MRESPVFSYDTFFSGKSDSLESLLDKVLPDIAHPESDQAEWKFLHFSEWQKMTFHKHYLQLADIRDVLQHPHRNSWAKDNNRVEFPVREERE